MPVYNFGGGGGGAFAFIIATYPVSSTCTCTNTIGSRQITATQKIFYISASVVPFNCVVTATDGYQSATETISITAEGQSTSTELAYRLPPSAIYQTVEYLESTGTQYISTGIAPSRQTKVEADIMPTQSSNNTLLGCDTAYGTNAFYIIITEFGFGRQTTQNLEANARHEYTMSASGFYIDGTYAKATSTNAIDSSVPIQLFGRKRASADTTCGKVRIYGLKLYENDVLTADYIPCYRRSDSVAGMWEAVTKTFMTNDGSGTFVVGGNV